MRNIKLVIAYDGTCYAGWQRQKNKPTIQGVVEDRLAVMTGDSPVLHGAGRTDAGVHALGMVANFVTGSSIPCLGLIKGLNSLLPEDIRILAAEEAGPDFHARRSAIGKCYCYQLETGGVAMPTRRLYWHHVRAPFELSQVWSCLELLRGRHDFSSFEATGSRDRTHLEGRGAVREITRVELRQLEKTPQLLQILIAGDGFLRHMVRNIVGTLIDVGHGKVTVAEFGEILRARDRSRAGATAPANGLVLQEVYY